MSKRGTSASKRLPGRFLASELKLIMGRRRNQAGLAVLAAVPIVLAVAVAIWGSGGGPDLVSLVEGNGVFVPLAALGVEIAMFLPLAIAMLSGDTIAGEANLGTLRYLLAVPVGRTRLLLVKYASLCIGAFIGVGTIVVAGLVVGGLLFGLGPMTTLSGTQLGLGTTLGRLVLGAAYLGCALCAIAAVGLFVSTLTEQPIAATIAVMIFVILCTILGAIDQLAWLHPWLITNHLMAFIDVLRDPVPFDGMLRGLGVFASYAVVFWLAAWARFTTKDITN
ncbi:ABC transporter permease [Propionibacteriaceae bacterium Y1700]|uniref:ABC transporter permease n=1 Tax=Microlunatus sp. Y1700 TaxID=3418487 RepID=UPI003DA7286C